MEDSRSKLIWYLAAACIAAALGMRLLGGASDSGAASVAVDGAARQPTASAPPHARVRVWVHVAGAVRRPGLVRVAASARVGQAVDAAGGLTRRADLTAINLAVRVRDGQQVVVPSRGKAGQPVVAPAPGVLPGSPAAPATTAKISLATATVEQLDTLDGIGPALARRIIDWRDAHGGFRSVGQL